MVPGAGAPAGGPAGVALSGCEVGGPPSGCDGDDDICCGGPLALATSAMPFWNWSKGFDGCSPAAAGFTDGDELPPASVDGEESPDSGEEGVPPPLSGDGVPTVPGPGMAGPGAVGAAGAVGAGVGATRLPSSTGAAAPSTRPPDGAAGDAGAGGLGATKLSSSTGAAAPSSRPPDGVGGSEGIFPSAPGVPSLTLRSFANSTVFRETSPSLLRRPIPIRSSFRFSRVSA